MIARSSGEAAAMNKDYSRQGAPGKINVGFKKIQQQIDSLRATAVDKSGRIDDLAGDPDATARAQRVGVRSEQRPATP